VKLKATNSCVYGSLVFRAEPATCAGPPVYELLHSVVGKTNGRLESLYDVATMDYGLKLFMV